MMDIDHIPDVDVMNIAFVNPNCNYKAGQKTFAGTGLDFSQDFSVVHDAIGIIKGYGAKVMISVGGASYQDWKDFNPPAVYALCVDLGCDGVDIDYEVGGVGGKELSTIVYLMDEVMPNDPPLSTTRNRKEALSIAVFSTGAYPPDGDQYKGMNINVLQDHGSILSWVNIMSYDAGPLSEYDPLMAYAAYRKLYAGPLLIGMEIGKEGWGSYLLSMNDVIRSCNYLITDPLPNGIFVWAYHSQGLPDAPQVLHKTRELLALKKPAPPVVIVPPVVQPPPVTANPVVTFCSCPKCGTPLAISIK